MATSEAVIESPEFEATASPPDGQRGTIRRLYDRAKRPELARAVISLVDQGILSLTNFSSIFLIAKFTSQAELGYYVTAFSLTMFANAMQLGLITAPYTIRFHGLDRDAVKAYAGNALLQQLSLSALGCLLLVLLSLVALVVETAHTFVPLLAVLAFALPCFALREFYRRVAYAHMKMGTAAITSFVAFVAQIGYLLTASYLGWLNAVTAVIGLGASSAMAAFVAYLLMRQMFAVSGRSFRGDLGTNWHLGKWLCADQVVVVTRGFSMHWMLMLLLGPAATGLYTACWSFVMLTNPLQIGLTSFYSVHAAAAFHEGGIRKLYPVLQQARLLLTAIIGAFAVVMVLGGERLVVLAYGDDYLGSGPLITIMSLTIVVFALEIMPSIGLWALSLNNLTFRANLIGLCVTFAVGFPLVIWFEVVGGAIASAIGIVAAFLLKQGPFRRLVREDAVSSEFAEAAQ